VSYRDPAFLGAKLDAVNKELKRLRCSCIEPRRVTQSIGELLAVGLGGAALGIAVTFGVVPDPPQPVQYTPKTWVNAQARTGRWLMHQRYKTCMHALPEEVMDPATWWDLCSTWADTRESARDIIHGHDHGNP